VGVILNLSVWFGLHVLFGRVERMALGPASPWVPDFATIDLWALALTVIAAILLLRLHLGIASTLAIAAVCGLVTGYLPDFPRIGRISLESPDAIGPGPLHP
jgi:chromate transporter